MLSFIPRRVASRALATSPSLLPRCLSTSPELCTLTTTSPTTLTLTLNRPPVNSLSLEMAAAITAKIKEAESTPGATCLIVESHSPKVFCAGLDITEMHEPSSPRLTDFWSAIQDLFLALYTTPLTTVTSIRGHAPAGGCLLCLSCDYRVMTSGGSIGLNEARLGIAAPYWLADLFARTIGPREAEVGLGLGKMYSPQEALEIGLVDELSEDVSKRCVEVAEE